MLFCRLLIERPLRGWLGGLLLSLAGASLMLPSPQAYGENTPELGLDYVDAVFSVDYNGKDTAGENTLRIRRDGDNYTVDFNLDHWLLQSRQHAEFAMQDCQVRPLFYSDTNKRPFKKEEEQQVRFDWSQHEATFVSPEDTKQFTLDENDRLFDPLSFFFEARCAVIGGAQSFQYPVIRKGNSKSQEYRIVDKETVATPLGDFEALVVERVRENPKRQTRLYVAPELDYLLVKIEHQESPMLKIVATLKEMDYALKSK